MSVNAEGRSDSKIQMMRYLKESLETASKLTLSTTPEDVAIFIGTTKSGKSTLLNSLLGNHLIGEKQPKLRSISIVKADNSVGPEIGRGPTSETVYPSRWVSSEKLSGLVLWDSPGFEDNRGPVQDIINAFYVYNLFRKINSAKIVLVTDVNDVLNDRINPFLSLLTSLENLFKEKLNNCFSNIAIAFTKVPSTLDDEPVNVNFICEVLQHQILSSDSIEMSQSTKNFIRHLTENRNQIGLFKKATVGPVPMDASDEIVQAIQSINGVQHRILYGVSPSIAHASQLFLHETRHELTSSKSFKELEKSIKAAFKDKLDKYKSSIEEEKSEGTLSTIKDEVMQFKNKMQEIIVAKTAFHSKIEAIHNIDPEFSDKIEANDLIEKSKMMEFIDSVLGLKESQIFNVRLRAVMETTKSEVNEIIVKLQVKLHEITREEATERIKQILKEAEEERKNAEQERKNFEKENKEVEKRFFTKVGEKVGETVDDVVDAINHFKDKIFKW